MRRSGTLLKFNKIAHGLDPNISSLPTARQASVGLGLEDDVFSASTIDISDINENNEELEDDKEGRNANQNRYARKIICFLISCQIVFPFNYVYSEIHKHYQVCALR